MVQFIYYAGPVCAGLLLQAWWNRWGQGAQLTTDPTSERDDSCSVFPSLPFSCRGLQPPSVFACRCICPLFTSHSSRPLAFTLLFSHCLFICPRLNSDSFYWIITPTPHRGCHGDQKVHSELGGGGGWGFVCASACLYVTAPQANTSRTEVSLWPGFSALLPGHLHTLMPFLCII